ncbi:16S ribosomal RNA methyltransferase A [Halocatena pleomorpha]|uniref:Probable ribosomal RNA small subunit methyltransferase A n=1 Tax=Halocatena pleomorpha TaxID=1785090 RepID=A0A3P3RIS9_9EURY|nr:16S ribosomal RNA methyltransferase A [Halocatena pleomorpha]RRJ33446.1 16S ribosomal RNA methyltransferase A [Halocatena pleomorpha]
MKDSSSRSFRDPDALIARAGVAGEPDYDQHFLVDDRVLDRLTGYLPTDTDTSHLLEIGAGTGALTDRLLAHGERVTAVERDPTLVEFLRTEFEDAIAADRLTVIEGDALDVELPDATASVSNLPYSASSDILFRLLPRSIPLVVMVQREFAARMAADPGTDEYGRLSVTAGHYGESEIVEPVPQEAFSPAPPVESAVVQVVPRSPAYTVPDDAFFLDFVTAVFTQRRKTVRNAIRNTAHISNLTEPENVVAAVDDETLRKRPGDLSPTQFAALARSAFEHGEPTVDGRD